MAHQPRRVVLLEWRLPPQCARRLLQHAREFVTNNVDAEFTHLKNKRPPPDTKLRIRHVRAVDTLRLIASATGHPGVAQHMRKLARDTLKDIG
jgi:hypothetical protein